MRRMNRLLLVAVIISMLIFSVFAEAAVPKTVIDASESVVNIMAEYTDGYSSGSGFVIESTSTRTLIATNHHVIAGDPLSISVWISETEKINAHILSASEQKDLCVLELAYPIPYAALAMKRDGAEKGDAVYAIGFPGAADYLSTTEAHTSDEATITDGIVSAIRQTTATEYGPEIQLLQINAAINPGNSGGPLLNADGFVVGINTYKAGESEGIFGAIAIGELLDYLADNAITIEETSMSENVWIWIAVVVLAVLSVAFVILKKKHKSSKRDNTQSAVVETVSLQQFISKREQKLTAEEAVSLLMPVAIELRNFHNDGRPHLEINPKNITIKGDKATLSQPAGNEAARYASGYAAPEIYKGRSNGHLSDIYSFCAVLVYSMTGVAPNNSLTREESGIVGVLPENNMIPNGIAGTIEKGMALSAENRFDSMQSLIYCLAPYNTGVSLREETKEDTKPQTTESEQKEVGQLNDSRCDSEKDDKPRKKSLDSRNRKKVRLMITIIAIVVLISAIIGFYFIRYKNAQKLTDDNQFIKAKEMLILEWITKIHDEKFVDYLNAGVCFEHEDYETAESTFAKLKAYRNSEALEKESRIGIAVSSANSNDYDTAFEMLNELSQEGYSQADTAILDVEYQQACYWLNDLGEYDKARRAFLRLVEKDYPGAEDMATETVYLWIDSCIESDNLINALSKTNLLPDNERTRQKKEEIVEDIYVKACDLYHTGKYNNAEDFFKRIKEYKDADRYITLCNVHQNMSAFSRMSNESGWFAYWYKENMQKYYSILCKMSGFEDADDLANELYGYLN